MAKISMDIPAVHLFLLEQGDRSLNHHTRSFLHLACLTHYPDRSLHIFYHTGLSKRSKALLPMDGPQRSLPSMWSGCWCSVAHISLSALLRKTSPPPLWTQSPASRQPLPQRNPSPTWCLYRCASRQQRPS